MATKVYQAPWGRRIWVITSAVALLGIGTAVALPMLFIDKPENRWSSWAVPAVMCGIIGGTSFWMIRRYELTDDAIHVRRVLWTNSIPLQAIESVEVDPLACKGAWKTMGNDGLFAMHGRFRSKRLGKFQGYITNPAHAVVLSVPGDKIVLSPEHPRKFADDLNRRLARLKEQH